MSVKNSGCAHLKTLDPADLNVFSLSDVALNSADYQPPSYNGSVQSRIAYLLLWNAN